MAILTYNIKDFAVLAKSYDKLGKTHFGIIVSNQIPFGDLLKRTLKLVSTSQKDSLKNRFIWLTDYK
jgi:hypothetical protein